MLQCSHPIGYKASNDVEVNPGPTIFDIIDSATTVSADSSFFFSVKFYFNREKYIYLHEYFRSSAGNWLIHHRTTELLQSALSLTLISGNKYTPFFEEI